MENAKAVPEFLNRFGRDTAVDIFGQITSKNRIRYRIIAKWQYHGKGVPMTPISWRRVPYRAALDNTGTLRDSISYDVTKNKEGYEISFSMEEYALYIEYGRKAGKGIPVDVLQNWIKTKPIRYRDARGRFAAMTQGRLETLSFLINRKIKTFGIEPVPFIEEGMTMSMEAYEKQFEEMGFEFVAEELIIALKNKK